MFRQPVAVKLMLKITVKSVRAFREEILLTAALRHPNIVGYVGSCWGEDLMCLLLEVRAGQQSNAPFADGVLR